MTNWDFSIMQRLYGIASLHVPQERVSHGLFREFCAASAGFARVLAESVRDPYWLPLTRSVRRFRFDCSAAPIPFSAVRIPYRLSELRARYANCQSVYPQVRNLVLELLDRLEALMENRENPMLGVLAEQVDRDTDQTTAVLCDARLLTPVRAALAAVPELSRMEAVAQHKLRSNVWHKTMVLFGAPSWYDDFVFGAPRSDSVRLIRYAWVPGRVPRTSLFTAVAVVDERGPYVDAEHESVADVLDTEGIRPEDGLSELLLAGVGLDERRGNDEPEILEQVRAVPTLLEGERAVFLEAEDDSTVLILDLEEEDRRRVHRIPVADLTEGTFVLLRSGGGGDYVLPVADVLLGARAAELRAMQQEWKKRLRELVRRSSLLEVSVRLLDLGSRRADEGNLRRWMWGRSIRPQDRSDFNAIMRVIDLNSEADRYWTAMTLIDRAHLRAGQVIRKALLQQVRKADLSDLERIGSMEFDLPGAAVARMIACRVVKVGRETVKVSTHHVGRLLEIGS